MGKRVRSFPSRGKELYRTVCSVYADGEMKKRAVEMSRSFRHQTSLEEAVVRIEALVDGNR